VSKSSGRAFGIPSRGFLRFAILAGRIHTHPEIRTAANNTLPSNVSFASLPLFVPTIISEMGAFTRIQSQGLSAPPYVFCFLSIIALCWLSDRFKMRGPFCALAATLAGIGFIINATTDTTGPRYFSIFLSVEIFASVALLLAWVANIHATESKRAGGYTVLATVGQCGPLLGELVMMSRVTDDS
jgi:hypothetical protein